jgi:hypothetical protein
MFTCTGRKLPRDANYARARAPGIIDRRQRGSRDRSLATTRRLGDHLGGAYPAAVQLRFRRFPPSRRDREVITKLSLTY